jgi:hypothetical protein
MKGFQAARKALNHTKKNIQYLNNEIFFTFPLFVGTLACLNTYLDPEIKLNPDSEHRPNE